MDYFLARIYPKWPIFVSSPTIAANLKVELFKAKQESAREDVEQVFGVLRMRWGIIQGPSIHYYHDMNDVIYTCIILHNMIIEDEGPMVIQLSPPEHEASSSTMSQMDRGVTASFCEYIERTSSIRDSNMHENLIADLIEELWSGKARD